ncbi:hypothetical protein DAPPUDRAFT_229881 [Daphnia pulex]|uniref:Uncharacterized protein n=1 Tax=Daphnia pulex TaxID=6669 RepID=E9HWJ0_DAPPU|nr:hypothetical protein DAPPUDRAFT_229881 [Daphnia pulex]|eukprot:EFX63896.1 hypothetical protein DAPPUDRAFT_229881 [Daphnia pulex]
MFGEEIDDPARARLRERRDCSSELNCTNVYQKLWNETERDFASGRKTAMTGAGPTTHSTWIIYFCSW